MVARDRNTPVITASPLLQPVLIVQAALVCFFHFHSNYKTTTAGSSQQALGELANWLEDNPHERPKQQQQSRQEGEKHTNRVPRIIHQSWRTKKLEAFQIAWQKTWLDNHPNWTYMFWTDKDNRKLIAEHFPWFLEVYDQFPRNIQRADCARYFYMLRYGGCYFDLDFESLKNLDPLMHNLQAAVSYMTADTASEISIPNAFLASVPGHTFWYYVIQRITMAFVGGEVDKGDVHRITGPIMLKRAVESYQLTSARKNLEVFRPETVIGVDFNWRDDPKMRQVFLVCHAASSTFNTTRCKEFFPDSYALTYWSGDITWMADRNEQQS
ncbi:TPA: hypothetical protein ACH3X3_004908 [Trebouxia sp. C0006]